MKKLRVRLTYANVMATIAVFIALGGASYAATKLPKNSVGPKQLKKNAVSGPKVAAHSLTGEDLNLSTLGTVPNATNAVTAGSANMANSSNHANTAGEAETVNGFEVGCFPDTVLIRGMCFDTALNSAVSGVRAAANACAAKGGFLPDPMTLYSISTVINLGNGTPPNLAVSSAYYVDDTTYKTTAVDGSGTVQEWPVEDEIKYICAYTTVG